MKIMMLNMQFERGGAARVASVLCNELHNNGHEIILVTDWSNYNHTYGINPDVRIREICTKGHTRNKVVKLSKWLKCVLQIRKYIKEENPDVVIAIEAMMFLCGWLGNLGLGKPIIAADHTSFNRKINPIIDFVRYHLYKKADGLSILTKKDAVLLGDKFPNKCIIYNPLSFPVLSNETSRRKNILCAGRLEVWKIKGFDIILNIWAEIQEKYPEWKLEIAGYSNDVGSLNVLNEIVENKKLKNRVVFLGQINDMQKLYSETSIFALPSKMEGFPMVLMEAMSQGCACVAFSIFGAANEMLGEGDGFVVPDNDYSNFRDCLEQLIINEELRDKFSFNARQQASQFSTDSFVESWELLLKKVLQ